MEPEIKTGAEIIWECLIREGVEVVFGYPGAATLPLYGVLDKYDGQIRHVLTRHEQGATHAADGYARASGKVGVAMATSGPGATNMVTGIATAMRDASPIVCITGQVNRTSIGTDAFQEVDMIDITMPITKHNYLMSSINELADTICEAFYIARTGRPGPVLIDIPKNIQDETIEFQVPTEPITLCGYKDEDGYELSIAAHDMLKHNLAAAIGASFYAKDQEAWVFVSNNAVEMPVAELATMVQENINIKVVVINNDHPGSKDLWPQSFNLPASPDYFKLAQAYGIPGYHIDKFEDIIPAMRQAQAHRGPVLIESMIDWSKIPINAAKCLTDTTTCVNIASINQ
jgi:thiamine pyrophosphate-dependent acetolactate synthase large subunit-like protein